MGSRERAAGEHWNLGEGVGGAPTSEKKEVAVGLRGKAGGGGGPTEEEL
jgi:hypothetical protein